MKLLIILLFFSCAINAQMTPYDGPNELPDSLIRLMACNPDTAIGMLSAAPCDSCNTRLRVGYIVSTKCTGVSTEPVYYNIRFLDKNRQPLLSRVKVFKYERKKDNE